MNVDTFHVADRLAKDDALRAAVVQRATATTQLPPASGDDLNDVAKQIDEVKRLGLPLGWAKANQPGDVWSGVGRVFGWVATILAVSLGAPLWFDVLGKFSKIRNAGNREGTGTDDGRSAEDPRVRSAGA